MTARAPTGRLALSAAALLGAAVALAAAAEPLPASVAVRDGRVLASVDLAAAFPPALEHTLGNGLTNVVAVYVGVSGGGGGEPAVATGRVIDILYDVWEETYVVTVKDPRTPAGERHVLPDFAALRAFLAQERDLDLGPASALPPGDVSVEARVEVNPISKELLERTREFIANPTSGSRPGGSRSVLGAMAGFLLREPATGADVHLFRSRPVAVAQARGPAK